MSVEGRLAELGLELPPSLTLPPGLSIPFSWVRVHGNRAFLSGHGALTGDGQPAGPFGRVPSEVSVADAQRGALGATLALLAGVRETVGSLDRIGAWLTVSGHVNADPGFRETTLVMNPASELLLDLFGPERGAHARTAIGAAALPLNMAVVIAAEVVLVD